MRIAYADPPYLGSAAKHYADKHEDAADFDTLEAHADLIQRLQAFDGWALSMTSGNLRDLLPLCPPDVRVMAWVKPFASFKPNVNPAYAWEPIVVKPARALGRDRDTARDWVSANITLQTGMPGAKPLDFCIWLFEVLGLEAGDEFADLFPGSGAVGDAYRGWIGRPYAIGLFQVEGER